MSTKKWEQLIDHMLNEDQERAEQLFHEIVVEQSRAIYESLMDEDDAVGSMIDEISDEEHNDMAMEADDEMDMDDADMDMGDAEADMDDADMDMDDAEADMDDADMDMDDAESDMGDADMDMGDEDEGEPATKDDIMNLEDKLDELMAEFESLMHSKDEGGEEPEEEEGEEEEVMESVQLQQVGGKQYNQYGKMGDDGDKQAKSPVAANAGGKGPVGSVVHPVKTGEGKETVPTGPKSPSNAYSKGQGQLPGAGSFKNAPNGAGKVAKGQGEAAPKPKHEDHKSKSPVAESKKTTKRVVK